MHTLSTDDIFVFIDTAPVITQGPANQSIPIGESVTFTCSATGYPEAVFTWYYGNEMLDGADTVITAPAQYGSLFEQMSTLVIDDLTLSNEGNYICNVNNGVGTVEASATLNVEGRYHVYMCYILIE